MRLPTPRQIAGALLGTLAVMSLQGCKRIDMVTQWTPASPSPTAYLEDSQLTSRVRAALNTSPVVNSFNIGVESHQGVVLLSGMAADPTQIDLAVFVAQTVPGVRSVGSFMFSAGELPGLVSDPGASIDPDSRQPRRPLGNFPHAEPSSLQGPPQSLPIPVISLSDPLPPEDGQPLYKHPGPSRWMSLAYSVLGIRSIQEELLIKQ